MSDALYERYKEALRRGHVAAQRGRDADALEAYGEAARLAPDRALPLVAIGGVLRRLGKTADALTTYGLALDRAPADEAALRGRAETAAESGDRVDAAETYDRLAIALDGRDRLADAADAARHALELAESRARRATMRRYAERLAAAGDDPAVSDALARAMLVLDARVTRDAPDPDAAPEPPPPPPIDPIAALDDLADAVERGDSETARALALAVAAGNRAADRPATAIDACYAALAVAPADPGLHLTLAELYLDRGWRPLAIDKLDRLARLASLTDDGPTRERVCALAATHLPDEPRLAAHCG
jgi:tetratricopeptide (TPR) repeat protein